MILTISGKLTHVGETSVSIESAPFEYEVLVADYTRRQLQNQLGTQTRLHTLDYIEGNPQGGRMTPRLIGKFTRLKGGDGAPCRFMGMGEMVKLLE